MLTHCLKRVLHSSQFVQFRGWVVCRHGRGFHSTVQVRSTSDSIQQDAVHIFNTAVDAVLPRNMVYNALRIDGNNLIVGEKRYALNRNVHILSFGKAALGMVRAAEDVLGDHVVKGVVSAPFGIQDTLKSAGKHDLLPSAASKVKVMEGAKNNIPDAAAHVTALEIKALAESLKADDIALTLITGGGSALLPTPIPPVTLDEMIQVTKLMSKGGATIWQMNTVRKSLEILKGGGLAEAANPAQVVSLILSDVIGDPLDLIASGPTVADFSTARQCLDHFQSLGIMDGVPPSIKNLLNNKAVQENLVHSSQGLDGSQNYVDHSAKPQPMKNCNNAYNLIVGSNRIAVDKAYTTAESLGYLPFVLACDLDGDAKKVGEMLSALAQYLCESLDHKLSHDSAQSSFAHKETQLIKMGIDKDTINDIIRLSERACNCDKPVCILAAGETTVNVTGDGIGGRNQEMVLASSRDMQSRLLWTELTEKFDIGFLSAGTDGQDGPTLAAGAFCNPFLVDKAANQGLEIQRYLDNNDSNTFFNLFDEGRWLVNTGLTGTNVMDIQVLLVKPHHLRK